MENKRLELVDLKPAEGSTHRAKRVGRGISSGRSKKRGFEGGQTPSYKRFSKLKRFRGVQKFVFGEVNVSRLNNIDAEVIDVNCLKELGILNSRVDELRVLGNGELSKAVTVKARHFSKSAKQKIEAAGGKIEEV